VADSTTMSRPPLDPNEIPEDSSAGVVAAYIGEDISRIIMLRVSAFAGAVAIVAGLFSHSAPAGLKAACIASGSVGLAVLLAAQLFRIRRSRQWVVIFTVLLVCGSMLLAVLLNSR